MADQASSSAERITVTYAASQALLSAPLTPHFINLLKEQLPLRNLHWRPSQSTLDAVAARAAQQGKSAHTSTSVVPGSTIRTIQTLDVALKPLIDEVRRWRGDPGYFEQPPAAGLLDRPFVHLYLVVCEDSEHYRTTVRNEIRSWISSLSFFHAKQVTQASRISSSSMSNQASSSRNSLALGSFRSATPPVRSETPPSAAPGSGPSTPSSGIPSKTNAVPAAGSTVPTEPEYLIVLITPPEGAGITGLGLPGTASAEAKTGMGRFINKSKGNVLEKVRADFNTSKKEHVVQLSRLPPVPAVPLGQSQLHSMDPTIWAELLTKMREAASSTFTTTIEAQEEEIARCGVTRGQQGWDFCSYFLAKDALARTLEAVGLKDDAVGQYEDLEIVFAQAMQNGAVSFAPVGGDDPNDDSLPLLDVTKKPYPDLIRRREISLFDFRCYLFARKSALLGKMGRVAAVMREAPLFISAVGRMLKGNNRLGSQWIESWIFSAALDVVEQCQAWLIQRGGQSMTSDDQLSPAFQSNKSELLDVARRQLDRIGIEAGHLPATEPFAFPSTEANDAASNERDLPPLPDGAEGDQKRQSSRPELKQAIESREHFDSHYLALCERILAGWQATSRKRDALHIRTIIATLSYLRGKHQAAYDSLVGLTEAYAAAKFSVLEGHSLAMQLECHAKLNKQRDRAWIASALAALRVSVQAPMRAKNVEAEAAKWMDPAYLCEQLRAASIALEREVPVSGFPLFLISVPQGTARLAGTEDGSLLTVDVHSLLPCAQAVEDVRVCVTTGGGASLWYTSSKTDLTQGTSKVELFCPHPAQGVYTLDVTQIRFARLIFQYDHSATQTKEATIVRVPKDAAAPSVRVALPRQIDLDKQRAVEVIVSSGRNSIERAEFTVTFADGSSAVDCSQAKAASDSVKVDEAQGSATSVTIRSIEKDSEAVVTLPLTQIPESGILDATVSLTYTTPSPSQRYASGKQRTLKTPVSLRTALPLGVNVQDFFRTSCLLSKFTISAGGGGSIRLRPVTLVSDAADETSSSPYQISGCGSGREAMVIPRQPANYLFRISKKDKGPREDKEKAGRRLRLAVEYRTLVEDAIDATKSAMEKVVVESGEKVGRLLREALVGYVQERLDLPAFSITGQVKTGSFDADWWRREMRSWGKTALAYKEVEAVVKHTLEAMSSGSLSEAKGGEDKVWQKLTIPVDVPSVDYVNAVTLNLAQPNGVDPASTIIVVGQPVQLTVSISTSTQWSATPETQEEEGEGEMVYDIVPDFETWLVDGAKRGTFRTDQVRKEFQVDVTVVPLRVGTLALPDVLVRPLSAGKSCESYTTNAAQRVQAVAAKATKVYWMPTHGSGSGRGVGEEKRESWKSARMFGGGGEMDRNNGGWAAHA